MRSTLKRSRRALGTVALLGSQLGQESDIARQPRRSASQAIQTLPAPRLDGPVSVEAALRRRRSIRSFTRQQLTAAEIGQLLWAAQGITAADGFRTAPSAGALYPLECYVVTAAAVFHYDPRRHRLTEHVGGDMRAVLAAAALDQAAVAEAPAVMLIAAVYERTARKYGEERARRYAMLEAGHAAQNVLLEATALGLGAVPIGAFTDRRVAQLLRLAAGVAPLYLIPVGHPRR